MSCQPNCDTVQLIEPNDDLIVDTAGQNSDVDERGEVILTPGQVNVEVIFQVVKLNTSYSFEYLYVDALGNPHPGGIQVIPTFRAITGFSAVFAGSPIVAGYILHWRVVIRRTSILNQIDAPEHIYMQMPRTTQMLVPFSNPRSGINYGFSELRVENLHDLPLNRHAVIRVQVCQKNISSFLLNVNPRPPSDFYFLVARTP